MRWRRAAGRGPVAACWGILLLLAWPLGAAGLAGGTSFPRLRRLGLRSADRPLDLDPLFSPTHFVYTARLDFSDSRFSVDAIAGEGSKITNWADLQTEKEVGPGSSVEMMIKLQHVDTKKSIDYTISVARLDGTDVRLRALAFGGGCTVSPLFDPNVLQYTVRLSPQVDVLAMRFVPWDLGQTFDLVALEPEDAVDSPVPPGGQLEPAMTTVTSTTTRTSSTTTTTERPGCYDRGWWFGPVPDMAGQGKSTEETAGACQARCAALEGCAHFSYWPDKACHLQDSIALAQQGKGVVSGPPACHDPCFVDGMWYGPEVSMAGQDRTTEADVASCQLRCSRVDNCSHFTFWPDGGCHLQDAAATPIWTDVGVVSGPPVCGGGNASGLVSASRRQLQGEDGEQEEVREPPSGEGQYAVIERRFPIGVGQRRIVAMHVRAANRDAAQTQVYRFQVQRDPCPQAAPLFAPDAGDCTVTCNPGYFASAAERRCEACAHRCLVCNAWADCRACEASHWRALHFVRLEGGRCVVLAPRWRRLLLGAAGAIAGLAACACACGCGHHAHVDKQAQASWLSASTKHGGAFKRRRRSVEGGPETDRLLQPEPADRDVGKPVDDE